MKSGGGQSLILLSDEKTAEGAPEAFRASWEGVARARGERLSQKWLFLEKEGRPDRRRIRWGRFRLSRETERSEQD